MLSSVECAPAWLALSLRTLGVGEEDLEASACWGEAKVSAQIKPSSRALWPWRTGFIRVYCVASLSSDLQKQRQMPKDANRQNSRKPAGPRETSPLPES